MMKRQIGVATTDAQSGDLRSGGLGTKEENVAADRQDDMPVQIFILLGTRPEAIKLAPVVRALKQQPRFDPVLISTGQHRELLNPLLETLQLSLDLNLSVMVPEQSLSALGGIMIRDIGDLLRTAKPDIVLVHGDTSTAFAGAVAAFYEGIPVAHVEAGLRSGSLETPFPEEFHRYAIARLARWHFAPTHDAAGNLLAEGIDTNSIEVTGNTVVDSLKWVIRGGRGQSVFSRDRSFKILVTLHRRELQGRSMREIAEALARLAEPEIEVLFLLHKNPVVRKELLTASRLLTSARFLEPLIYTDFVQTLRNADLIVTDSGGVQEEASILGKRILVVRKITDRPEAVDAGNAEVVGICTRNIIASVRQEISRAKSNDAKLPPSNAFGDGRSAGRIVRRLSMDCRQVAPATPSKRELPA
jgi:UDP-N-acetylglucosamine 2-epimerase (non-hydrolysing)